MRTVPQVEDEIRASLLRVGLAARGLWHEMRYLVEHETNARPGELRMNGAPMDAEQIAQLAGCSAAKAPPLLDKLMDPGVGLLRRLGDGTMFAPHLAAIAQIRASQRRRTAVNRQKEGRGKLKVLRNTETGVTCAGCNTPGNTLVPPEVSPLPITLSSSLPLSASSSCAKAAEGEEEGKQRVLPLAALTPGDDELDLQIRRYVGAHPMLTYDPTTHAKLRKLVLATGWDPAKGLIEDGINQGVSFPIGWALGKANNLTQRQAAARSSSGGNGRHHSVVAVADREDN